VVTTLTCTICEARPSFAKVRLEITGGAATYLVCTDTACIDQAFDRAYDNLRRAAVKAGGSRADVIDVEVAADVAAIEP
jgi:hypothetical protein